MTERLDWAFEHTKMFAIDDCPAPSSFVHKLETGVKNGDCLPACFAVILECLHRGQITSPSLQEAAAEMRIEIFRWIQFNWEEYIVFEQQTQVHELVWLQHDLGRSPEERVDSEEWGESADSRLVAYLRICETVYFTDLEMLVFACIVWQRRGVPMLFRIWRVTGAHQEKGELVHTLPERKFFTAQGVTEAIVIDMAHTGRTDHASAHYKLLSSASLQGLTCCRPKRSRDSS